MAGSSSPLLKFIPSQIRQHPRDVTAAAMWGVTAAVGALWMIQPFEWLKKTLAGKPEEEQSEEK